MKSLAALLCLFASSMVAACGSDSDGLPPQPTDDLATTAEDTPITVAVLDNDSDPDGDVLTVLASVNATNGEAEVGDDDQIVFTPAADFNGTASVTYAVSDGEHTVSGRLTIEVTPVNDAPVIGEATIQVQRRAETRFRLPATDVDGDELTFEVGAAARGTLTVDGADAFYTPATEFVGTEEISLRVTDGELETRGSFTLEVDGGSAPELETTTVFADEDSPVAVSVAATDADGDAIEYELEAPAHGSLSGTAPELTYTPDADYHGPDQFRVRPRDRYLSSEWVTISILVRPVNDAPVALDVSRSVAEDSTLLVVLPGSDIDNSALSGLLETAPAHGTASVVGRELTYVPAPDFAGADALTFRLSDGNAQSQTATVTISVTAVPDAPVALAQDLVLDEDSSAAIVLAGLDADGDPLTFTITSAPGSGTLTGTPPNLTYTPVANYHGSDSFSFVANDGTGDSDPRNVTLTIAPVNDAPVVADAQLTVNEDEPGQVRLTVTDPDDTTFSYSVGRHASRGGLRLSGSTVMYTPVANATGTDSFVINVSDGELTGRATVSVIIEPVADPPTARNDIAVTEIDTAVDIDVLASDHDPDDGDQITVVSVSTPMNGTTTIAAGGLVTYTPNAGFEGSDSFTYDIEDNDGLSATAVVSVGVGGFPSDAPFEQVPGAKTIHTLALSGDGRYLAYTGRPNGQGPVQVYLFDRVTQEERLISKNAAGEPGSDVSSRPSISTDGSLVAFQSSSPDLVAGDTGGHSQIYVYDVAQDQLRRISLDGDGSAADGDSTQPAIAGDGGFVAFQSDAYDLVEEDFNGALDVFVVNLGDGSIVRASVRADGQEAAGASSVPSISADGSVVAFESSADNMVTDDDNGADDIFVRDFEAETTTRVSISSTGRQANDRSRAARVSRDGRFVSFLSEADNLISGWTGQHGYVHDRATGNLFGSSVADNGAPFYAYMSHGLSGDGRHAVYERRYPFGMVLVDRFAGTSVELYEEATGEPAPPLLHATISADSRYVAFYDLRGRRVLVTPNPL